MMSLLLYVCFTARKSKDMKTIDTHLDLLLESAVMKLETCVKKMETFARHADVMAPQLPYGFFSGLSQVCKATFIIINRVAHTNQPLLKIAIATCGNAASWR